MPWFGRDLRNFLAGAAFGVVVCSVCVDQFLDTINFYSLTIKELYATITRPKGQQLLTSPVIEVCLSDITSAELAIKGGANSLEICTNRAEGDVLRILPSYTHTDKSSMIIRTHTRFLVILTYSLYSSQRSLSPKVA